MTFLLELWEVWEGRKGDLGGPDDTFGVFDPGIGGPSQPGWGGPGKSQMGIQLWVICEPEKQRG